MDNQQRINLGQAKNQAVEAMKGRNYVLAKDYQEAYPDWVRFFYKANAQLDSEILETGKRQDNNPPEQKQGQSPSLPTQLSDKQKKCPGCNKPIPKTWNAHFEDKNHPDGCGWELHPKGNYGERR